MADKHAHNGIDMFYQSLETIDKTTGMKKDVSIINRFKENTYNELKVASELYALLGDNISVKDSYNKAVSLYFINDHIGSIKEIEMLLMEENLNNDIKYVKKFVKE